jgi:hypothetical protein
VSAPETLPGSPDRGRIIATLGFLFTYLVATGILAESFGIGLVSHQPSMFWPAVETAVAFVAGFLLIIPRIPRNASLTLFDEGLIVKPNPLFPGFAVRWDAVALRGQTAYVYDRRWGPPTVLSLTKQQRERLSEWMQVRMMRPRTEVAGAKGMGVRLATIR